MNRKSHNDPHRFISTTRYTRKWKKAAGAKLSIPKENRLCFYKNKRLRVLYSYRLKNQLNNESDIQI